VTYWFTSDNHFGHKRIIEYAHRPFKTVEEMDEAMIQQWNHVVQPQDKVYVVGDFSFHRPDKTLQILNRLNGYKALILGNHDKPKRMTQPAIDAWGMVLPYYKLKVPDADRPRGVQEIVLLHYAMRVWDKSHRGSWHLYGHSHGSLPDDPNALSMDVGVDCHSFTPISYDAVKNVMKNKNWKPVDHHE
jgi:calcineurin-like phosphoesterase family protein